MTSPTITQNLTERIAVVTGASSGIGAATARLLAARGARVALLARRAERIEALAGEIGGLAVAHLTRVLRSELGPRGVRVRTVEPGLTDSELGDGMLDREGREFLAGFREKYDSIPAEDIAEAIAWSAALPLRVNVAELIVVPTTQG